MPACVLFGRKTQEIPCAGRRERERGDAADNEKWEEEQDAG